MRFIPFEQWVSLEPAPDLHQDAKEGIHLPVSYSRRKAAPNTGRWFRVVEAGDGVPPYISPGAPVLCNLSMLSDELDVGDETVSLMPFRQIAGARIGVTTMQHLETEHPVIPIGDYVLCKDDDRKHSLILGRDPSSRLHLPLMTLERGQRTDEAYETHVDDDGWETENKNRPNDGVKMMFSEVLEVGPEVPAGRLERGDMVAFRPNICGIRFDLFGISYRLVRCSEKNSETMGKVPRAIFERMLDKAS
jgi:hypothetical protein